MWPCKQQGGCSRGVQQGAVHQRAVVAVLDDVVLLTDPGAQGGLVGHPDLHRVLRVVEVDDVDVEDQHRGAGDEVACSEMQKILIFL